MPIRLVSIEVPIPTRRKPMWAALFSRDYATAIKNADMVLASDYVDIDAHMAEYMAYR
jgi:hypothetical protein